MRGVRCVEGGRFAHGVFHSEELFTALADQPKRFNLVRFEMDKTAMLKAMESEMRELKGLASAIRRAGSCTVVIDARKRAMRFAIWVLNVNRRRTGWGYDGKPWTNSSHRYLPEHLQLRDGMFISSGIRLPHYLPSDLFEKPIPGIDDAHIASTEKLLNEFDPVLNPRPCREKPFPQIKKLS